MTNTHGGARAGAGRPRKAVKHKRAIAKTEKRIADRLPELADKLLELAGGVSVVDGLIGVPTLLKKLEDAGEDPEAIREIIEEAQRVYLSPPSFKALEYLLNRIMGKPTEHQELTGEDGAAIPLEIEISFGGGDADAETEGPVPEAISETG